MSLATEQKHTQQLQQLARMMDQQFWRWGCDVKHDTGNLLVKYGFERIPPPDQELAASSAYLLALNTSTRLVLRSFAVFYGDDRLGGMLLKRFDPHPYRTPAADLGAMPYQESDLPPLQRAAADDIAPATLLTDLIEQIIAYETWVKTVFGSQYVQKTLENREKRPAAPADKAIPKWETIAQQYRQKVALKDQHKACLSLQTRA